MGQELTEALIDAMIRNEKSVEDILHAYNLILVLIKLEVISADYDDDYNSENYN